MTSTNVAGVSNHLMSLLSKHIKIFPTFSMLISHAMNFLSLSWNYFRPYLSRGGREWLERNEGEILRKKNWGNCEFLWLKMFQLAPQIKIHPF